MLRILLYSVSFSFALQQAMGRHVKEKRNSYALRRAIKKKNLKNVNGKEGQKPNNDATAETSEVILKYMLSSVCLK